MKLKLKENEVLVDSLKACNIKDAIELDVQHIKDPLNKQYQISFNDSAYKPIKDFQIRIPPDILKADQLKIIVKETNKSNKDTKLYKSETLPIGLFIQVGKTTGELYPVAIQELLYRIEKLEERLEALESEGDLL